MVQLSQPYVTPGKTIAMTLQTFVSRVMSLLFNILFRFVIGFLPKQLFSDFMAPVTIWSDLRAQEEEICYYFHFFSFYLLWSNGARYHDLFF